MSDSQGSERLPFAMMLAAIFAAGVGYGIFAKQKGIFPVPQINAGLSALKAVRDETRRQWYVGLPPAAPVTNLQGEPQPGLVMLVGVGEGPMNFVRVIDRDGEAVQDWSPDWFDIWPEGGDFPDYRRPKSEPGALLHGALAMENGDLIVNFEHLSTVRLNACGGVVWKLDNLGHHSLFRADDGTIWASSETYIPKGKTGYPRISAPYHDWAAQQISPDGQILRTISVTEVLRRNGLDGLLHLSSIRNEDTTVQGDTLHLNDVEVFPSSGKSPLFAPGDLMLSLRNISTLLVVDPKTLKVKWRTTGDFLRQHDPDFLPDGRIMLFDNNNLSPDFEGGASRILVLDPVTGTRETVFEGHGDLAFYSAIMGKQQQLSNGNVLVTSSLQGRAIEVDPSGAPVWVHDNRVTDEFNAVMTEATVLPQTMDKAFFKARRAACAGQ